MIHLFLNLILVFFYVDSDNEAIKYFDDTLL